MTPASVQHVLDAALHALHICRLPGDLPGWRSHDSAPDTPTPWALTAAVNIHYMMGMLPARLEERQQWIDALQSLQDPETGLFKTGGRGNDLLLTGACTSALSCLGQVPAHPPVELRDKATPEGLKEFLRGLSWSDNPEYASRQLSALYCSLVIPGEAGPEWEEQLHQWIDQEIDDHTGLLRRGCLAPVELDGHWTLMPYLCAHVYPLSVLLHSRQPVPLTWRLVDTALEVMEYHRDLFFKPQGQRHLPWVFCLSRSRFYTAHRFEEARRALERFVPPYLRFLNDQIDQEHFQSLSHIQWDIATLAELQQFLPGQLKSRRPLQQILDRHPFL